VIRLNMIVEGQTEEQFVHSVLREHLAARSVFVSVRCVETSRDKRRGKVFRGGMTTYSRTRKDIKNWMKEDRGADARFSSMFDFYHLPNDFPGMIESSGLTNSLSSVLAIEEAIRRDIDDARSIPYIQLHEFEALLFGDSAQLKWSFTEHDSAIHLLLELATTFTSPEEIDDQHPPSKRIIDVIPEYGGSKVSAGPLTAAKIGLSLLREKCPHFNAWICRLEKLVDSESS